MREIDWYDEYEKLRTMHSILKDILKERVVGIPHFAGENKELPKKYAGIMWQINDLLYDAEKFVSKKMF